MKLAALLALAGLVAVPTATDAGGPRAKEVVVHTDGARFAVPAGWHVAGAHSGRLGWPGEGLVASSAPLPERERGACGPAAAINALPRDGALVYVFEYAPPGSIRRSDFRRRPAQFALPAGEQQSFECVGRSHVLLFRERGRFFQAHVALGPAAEPEVALRILDSLRVAE